MHGTGLLNPSKLPPLVAAGSPQDRAVFEMWGRITPVTIRQHGRDGRAPWTNRAKPRFYGVSDCMDTAQSIGRNEEIALSYADTAAVSCRW